VAEQFFLSADGRLRDIWHGAFPTARALRLTDLAADTLPAEAVVWLLVAPGERAERLIASLRQRGVAQPLIVLADEPGDDDALAALATGASGYCNSHAASEVLQQVAMVVANGGVWVGQRLMQRLLAGTARLLQPSPSGDWARTLTERQREVLTLMLQGRSNKEIARELGVSVGTAKNYVAVVLRAYNASSRAKAMMAALNGGTPDNSIEPAQPR